MRFLTPQFWQYRSWKSYGLLPLSWLYSWGAACHQFLVRPRKVSIPVICIGNLTLGGSGKTPVVLYIVEKFIKSKFFKHHEIAIITRGYGGRYKGPLQVDPIIHTAADVGDEPLLLAQQAPTWIARNRLAAASAAESRGAKIIIMDDGLQNYHLHQNLRFLIVDGHYGFGNGFVFPSGPLRQNLKHALLKTDALVVIGDDKHNLKHRYGYSKHIFQSYSRTIASLKNDQPVVAFAGLGQPQKFHRSLLEANVNLCDFKSFPDHHYYSDKDMDILCHMANQQQAQLLTTAKDYTRIPLNYQSQITVCEHHLIFTNDDIINYIYGIIRHD